MNKITKIIAAATFALGLTACGTSKKESASSTASDSTKLTVIATANPHAVILEEAKSILKNKYNIDLEVTVTDEEGNEIANTTLAKVRFYERFKHINVTADGSIEYSDNYNTDVINKKVDLKLETPAKPPQSEIVVENKLKKFKITTTANSGGEISGKDENPYEEVEIYSNS